MRYSAEEKGLLEVPEIDYELIYTKDKSLCGKLEISDKKYMLYTCSDLEPEFIEELKLLGQFGFLVNQINKAARS